MSDHDFVACHCEDCFGSPDALCGICHENHVHIDNHADCPVCDAAEAYAERVEREMNNRNAARKMEGAK